MIPKLLACATLGATTLLGTGVAVGRWSLASFPTHRPVSATLPAVPRDPAAAPADAALDRFEEQVARIGLDADDDIPLDWLFSLGALVPDDFSAADAALDALPKSSNRVQMRTELFRRWAQLDPTAAAKAAEHLQPGSEQKQAIQAVALTWLRRDCTAALVWWEHQPHPENMWDWEIGGAMSNPDAPAPAAILAATEAMSAGKLRELVTQFAFARLAKTDAPAALAYAARQPAGPQRDHLHQQALEALARTDSATAIAQAADLAAEAQQEVIVAAATGAAGRDPAEAMALLDLLPTGRARLNAAQAITEQLAKEDPTLAIDFALTFPAGGTQNRLLDNACTRFAMADAAGALRWLNSLPAGSLQHAAAGHVWYNLVTADAVAPREAADFALNLVAPNDRDRAVTTAVARLAKTDRASAISWVSQLADSKLRQSALRSLASNWGNNDTTGAVVYAARLGGEDRTAFLCSLGTATTKQSTTTGRDQAAALPAGPDRDAFLRGAAEANQFSAPRQAAECLTAMGDSADKARLAANVVRNWANEDPSAAAAWLGSQPDLSTSAETCAALADQWAEWEPASAAQWVAQLPLGTARSAAAAAFVSRAQSTAPELAATWLAEIADPAQREQAAAMVAQEWLASDRTAATNWLAHSDLPTSTVTALLAGRPAADAEDEYVELTPFAIN